MDINLEQLLDETEPYIKKSKQIDTIQKIYTGYFNTNQAPDVFTEEFFYTVGEILSGKELKDLDLKYLNMKDILRKEQ